MRKDMINHNKKPVVNPAYTAEKFDNEILSL